MAPSFRTSICYLFIFLYSTNGETVKWCGTNQRTLISFKPIAISYAKSEIHCVALSFSYKHIRWLIQTVDYFDGRCTMYAESTQAMECSNMHPIGYWARNVSTIPWKYFIINAPCCRLCSLK